MRLDEKELKWRRKTNWASVYLRDMAKIHHVPRDWAEAAKYHISSAHPGKVRNIKVLEWKPTHVNEESRLIDHADVWTSLEIDGQPHTGLVCMGEEITVEILKGSTDDRLPYWREK